MTQRAAGFTLIEVLVAFVIAAMALAMLYEGASGGLFATAIATRTEEAVARARSHLAVVGHGTVIVPGDQSGDDGDGYRWRLSIRQVATAPIARGDQATIARGPHAALYAVTVQIAWRDNGSREVRLDSTAVGQAPPAPP